MSESISDTTAPTISCYPFNQPSADITLRTSDRIDFQVHSQILSQSSPVFADMLSLPQPSSSSQDPDAGRSVVDVTEDSKTLERLLRICYPIRKENLDGLDDIAPVLQAAMKYDMEWPISLLTAELLEIAPHSPLKTWAVASRYGMEELAQKAACSILKRTGCAGQPRPPPEEEEEAHIPTPTSPLSLLNTMLVEEGTEILHGISAADYFRLREYLRAGDRNATTRLLSPPTSPPKRPTEPPPPVDGLIFTSPPPDTVLQCSDGSTFHVHVVVLLLHSPLLGERLRAATTSASSEANQPAVSANDTQSISLEVNIDPATLSTLLAVMYAGDTHPPFDLHALGGVLATAIKFEMAQVTESAGREWVRLATTSPLEAYFVAIEHGLTDHARFAARKVLEYSVAGNYVAAMESSTALAYHRLLEYYRACARTIGIRMKAAATRWRSDLSSTNPKPKSASSVFRSANYGTYTTEQQCSRSLQNPAYVAKTYLTSLASGMGTDFPGAGCSFDLSLPALLRESWSVWPSCAATACQNYVEALAKLSDELPQVLADAIAEVHLEIP